MNWLVTGGAGYIGTHVVRALTAAGEGVVVLDDLSTGARERVPEGVPLVVGSVLDRALLDETFRAHTVDGVVHIAGKKQVPESVVRPLYYYEENVEGLRTLLAATVEAGVTRFLFSSSAAVYGMPDVHLVDEQTPCAPINPYGESKLVGEWLIRATARAHGLSYAALRYFNVAGAGAPELADEGVFNLVPMVFEKLQANRAPLIFGNDYDTADGTCVRDFIHVVDLAEAHVAAASRLARDADARLVLNVGGGEGTSVRAMVDLIQKVTGLSDVAPTVEPRRAGDPARVVASAARIERELGWKARLQTPEMVASAWAGWQRRH
ncbi:UDP-glucose 4-epimerase GalE [Streptomyces sp. SID3343]|uniref:UDP-glucose 4-epimerase GalE n=1 Tax=Streptomyces sp. SID3343 TaxID=2690260 RepID=UPI0013706F09|nr:UDP-glucose 4-epimerase GalE [Streptomyces sp. SID3343]MYW01589.1 UDP-glucose 4-epimerase GalE [Streptomyces sp. SID3343]